MAAIPATSRQILTEVEVSEIEETITAK